MMDYTEQEIIGYFKQMDRSRYMETDKVNAKIDLPATIGYGQTISQPSLVLKMTLSLDLQSKFKVLEIGTGSGFQTALLAAFSDTVYTVERIEPLYRKAKEILAIEGFTNIHFLLDNGSLGWKEKSPYDRIMVTAAVSKIPSELIDQLKPGGKMVIPVGGDFSQQLQRIEKNADGKISTTSIDKVAFVRLVGKYG